MTQHQWTPRACRAIGRALLAGALAPVLLAPPSWAGPGQGGVMLAQAETGGNAEELLRRQQRQQQGAPGQRQQRPQGEDGGAPQRGPQQNEGQRQRPPAPDARQGEPGGQPGRRPEPSAPRQPGLDAPRRESPPAAAQPRPGQPEPGAPAQAPRRQQPQPAAPEDAQAPRRTPEASRPDAAQKPPAPRAAPAEAQKPPAPRTAPADAPTPAAPQTPTQRQNRTPQPGQPPAPGETAPATPAAPATRAQEPRPPAPARAPDTQRPAGEAPVRPQPAPPAPQTQQAPARQDVAPRPGEPAPSGAPRPQATPAQPAPGQAAPAPAAPAQAAPAQGQPAQPVSPNGRRDGQITNPDGRVGQDQVQGQPRERRRGLDPGAAAALGAAAGFVGGYVASQGVRGIDDVRQRREEFTDNGVTVIREPGRTIVQENGRSYLRHDETERFRDLGGDVRSEQRGAEQVTVYQRPDGTEVVTVTDETGRLIRRTRRSPGGQEVVIIDNGWDRRSGRLEEEVVDLPPPRLRIPRERYVVDAEGADEETIYETLTAPEVDPVPQRYTLDQVRYSPDLRARMRSVDVDTITFETGSWEVDPGQASRLRVLADAVRRAVERNPREVFLVEGHTDAVGSDVDNLSLSDRRAQSVAAVLTRDFGVPPENLTTQGYGEQYLKVQTDGPARENRRVTLRRITPLLNGPQTSQQ